MIIDNLQEIIKVSGDIEITLPQYMVNIPNTFSKQECKSKIIAIGRKANNDDVMFLTGDYVPKVLLASKSLIPNGKIDLDKSGDFIVVWNPEYIRGYCVIDSLSLIDNSSIAKISLQI